MHDIVRLRVLAQNIGYALEPSVFRGRFRLIRLDIGHAVKDGETKLSTFTVHRGCVFLRSVEAECAIRYTAMITLAEDERACRRKA